MTIKEILKRKKTLFSFEVFPPKIAANFEKTISTASELCELHPDFMSVTYGAAGTTREYTVEIASKILSCGAPALAHLTCIGTPRSALDSVISRLKEHGIENVLALRGDMPKERNIPVSYDLPHASDLARLLKDAGFCVGGACYPEGHPEASSREEDIENLKYKVAAGVDFLTTQMFFDNNMFYTYLYRLRSHSIDVPVFAGIMPITSSSQVSRMIRLSSAYVPAKLLSICDRFSADDEAMFQAGIAYATDQIIDLISNGVRGIHIYTMNKPRVARSIFHNVDKILNAVNS